jgi:hypothetical protein
MNHIVLNFSVSPTVTPSPLALTARLNGHVFFEKDIDQRYDCEYVFDENQDTEYVLEFELSKKTLEHTRIDEQGGILEDSVLHINGIKFDNINVDQLIYQYSRYTHDFNGTQTQQLDLFYGIMGCNGIVRFEFSAPFYLWLLENM